MEITQIEKSIKSTYDSTGRIFLRVGLHPYDFDKFSTSNEDESVVVTTQIGKVRLYPDKCVYVGDVYLF